MKKRCLNRKGYFFLVDSMLALGVLAIGVFLIFALYTKSPSKEEATIFSEAVMDFFTSNKIKDVNNEYAGLGGELWKTEWQTGGLCEGAEALEPNPENTLLQQIAEFYEKSKPPTSNPCYFNLDDTDPSEPEDLAEKFILKLAGNVLPAQYMLEVRLHDPDEEDPVILYPGTEQTASKEATKVLIPSKKIVYGFSDIETGEMFGPYTIEVLVWQQNI